MEFVAQLFWSAQTEHLSWTEARATNPSQYIQMDGLALLALACSLFCRENLEDMQPIQKQGKAWSGSHSLLQTHSFPCLYAPNPSCINLLVCLEHYHLRPWHEETNGSQELGLLCGHVLAVEFPPVCWYYHYFHLFSTRQSLSCFTVDLLGYFSWVCFCFPLLSCLPSSMKITALRLMLSELFSLLPATLLLLLFY